MLRFLITITSIFLALSINAQKYNITGIVCDGETNERLDRATIQLLRPDSSYISGALSNTEGIFSIKPQKEGSYILKVSFIGMNAAFRNVTLSSKQTKAELGVIKMSSNAILLKEIGRAHV